MVRHLHLTSWSTPACSSARAAEVGKSWGRILISAHSMRIAPSQSYMITIRLNTFLRRGVSEEYPPRLVKERMLVSRFIQSIFHTVNHLLSTPCSVRTAALLEICITLLSQSQEFAIMERASVHFI
ncbi:hypothetical protein M3J07_000340 [Ascochyta lentis]